MTLFVAYDSEIAVFSAFVRQKIQCIFLTPISQTPFFKAKNSEPKNSNINLVKYCQNSSIQKFITVNLCNKIVTQTFLL